MNKIKVAFVYKKDNKFLSNDYCSKLYYFFFMKALKRNTEIEVTYIEAGPSFDCNTLTGHDVLLSYSVHHKFSPHYQNIRECKTPSLFLSGDQHGYPAQKNLIAEYGITNFFFMTGSNYFYKFFPKHCNYRQIFLGAEPEIYFKGIDRWQQRKSDKILNSGVIREGPFYCLRRMISSSPHMDYFGGNFDPHDPNFNPHEARKWDYEGNKYVDLLYQYRAAIVACTTGIVPKYFEIPACGCLPFLEVTPQNEASTLGYTDGVNAIFINEDNYAEKIEEYMQTRDDPKWHDMAKNAYEYALHHYTNDHGVDQLVQFMKEII